MVSMNKTLQEHIKEAVFAVEQEGILLPLVLEKFAQLVLESCLECGNRLAKHYIDNHIEHEQVLLLAAIADYSSQIEKILLELHSSTVYNIIID
jgi:hypothetical protein